MYEDVEGSAAEASMPDQRIEDQQIEDQRISGANAARIWHLDDSA